MNFQIICTFLIYLIIVFILTYYFNLFATKTEYTRSELGNIIPQLGNMLQKIYNNYSLLGLFGIILVSGFIGIMIPLLLPNWLFNSALLPAIIFFLGPKIAIYFEETRVTISDNYTDQFQVIYSRYYHYIIAGFNSGYASRLILNWAELEIISFYWLVLNLLIITFMVILILREDIFHNL